MRNICTTPYAIFGNVILKKPPCQDKVEEKQNHCCYNPVFISANLPSKPPVLQAVFSLLYSAQRGGKKCQQKNEWPLRLPICSILPLLCRVELFFVCIPQPEFHRPIAPNSCRAGGNRKEGEVFYSSCCCQKLSCEPTRRTRGHRRAGCSTFHIYIPHIQRPSNAFCTQLQSNLYFWTEISK